jgi:glycosyltransferase involved in cell wall biosynthesis
MRVTVSTIGRFHAFDLVQNLQRYGYLHRFISRYPTWAVKSFGNYQIDPSLYRSVLQVGVLSEAWKKIPYWIRKDINLQLWFHQQFDCSACDYISPDSNVFVGWSSLCLQSLRKAKSYGSLTVVDRGNSHMNYFMKTLQEEYEIWGLKYTEMHHGVCEMELQEYIEADKIAVPSLFVKKTFLQEGIPEKKLIHIPYGVSLSDFFPMPKIDKTFRIIHCGSITLRKGIQYLLQAFYELNLPDAELWLVGAIDSAIKPILNKYASNCIVYKGTQPQAMLRDFYSQCSVFCLASIEDGFGMVIPQAMACGLPVIHTTNTGGADIVRDGIDGFCVPIRDVESLKEKILFFYENPYQRIEMGNNALHQVRATFSWEDYGDAMISAYQQALSLE